MGHHGDSIYFFPVIASQCRNTGVAIRPPEAR